MVSDQATNHDLWSVHGLESIRVAAYLEAGTKPRDSYEGNHWPGFGNTSQLLVLDVPI